MDVGRQVGSLPSSLPSISWRHLSTSASVGVGCVGVVFSVCRVNGVLKVGRIRELIRIGSLIRISRLV